MSPRPLVIVPTYNKRDNPESLVTRALNRPYDDLTAVAELPIVFRERTRRGSNVRHDSALQAFLAVWTLRRHE